MTGYLLLDVLLQAIGGLGIFLLGMKYMSEGVQFVAGPRLRRMINLATRNRFMAVGMGTLPMGVAVEIESLIEIRA